MKRGAAYGKKNRCSILLLIVLALLTSVLWYTAPRTAEELYPDFSWEQVIGMAAAYYRCEDSGQPAKNPI